MGAYYIVFILLKHTVSLPINNYDRNFGGDVINTDSFEISTAIIMYAIDILINFYFILKMNIHRRTV